MITANLNPMELLDMSREMLILDLYDLAMKLCDLCHDKDYFVAPESGFYLNNHLKPILKPGDYFNGEGRRVTILNVQDLREVREPLFDKEGTIKFFINWLPLIPMMEDEPTLPVVEIAFIYDWIKQRIRQFAAYHQNCSLAYPTKYLVEDVGEDYESLLSGVLDPLEDKIIQFIGIDRWAIYRLEQQVMMAKLIRGVDYRIYDWHKFHYKEEDND